MLTDMICIDQLKKLIKMINIKENYLIKNKLIDITKEKIIMRLKEAMFQFLQIFMIIRMSLVL